MSRSLLFSIALRILPVMALAVAMPRLIPMHWVILLLLLAVSVVGTAFWIARLTRHALAPLERRVRNLPEDVPDVTKPTYREFDELSSAMAATSQRLDLVLRQTSGRSREFETLLDSMQDAVFAVDGSGRLLWTNQQVRRLLLPIEQQLAGQMAVPAGRGLVHLLRDPEVLDCVQGALHGTVSEVRSTSLVPGRIFEVIASPMPEGGAVTVLHDVTRIERAERTQRDFVANVSHELRTPLTSISGYVETLLDHEQLSEPAREFLATILKNASRMTRLTEDLLLLSRVESSALSFHAEPVRARILVQDAVTAMLGLAQDTGSVLEAGSAVDTEAWVDPDAVLQVLCGLIENAVKYGRTRSGPARVLVSAQDAPPHGVELIVRDFGQGIPSEHLPRIFERFYRVDKARSRESGGTGLGLAIAKFMVEAMGGRISVESELNQGASFHIRLPAVILPDANGVFPPIQADVTSA